MTTYFAKLTGNRRMVETAYPKALLTDVHNFRNHCWVDITPELAQLQPLGHHRPVYVRFSATTKPYIKQGTQLDVTLSINSIEQISKSLYKRITNENSNTY